MIRYFCDFCHQPALTREAAKSQYSFDGSPVAIPVIHYKTQRLEILLLKELDCNSDTSSPGRREKLFGDICLDCLIDAVRHGELNV